MTEKTNKVTLKEILDRLPKELPHEDFQMLVDSIQLFTEEEVINLVNRANKILQEKNQKK